MNPRIILFALFMFIVEIGNSQENKTIHIAQSIKEVTLYLNGAEVRSNEDVLVKRGETKVVIDGISPFMLEGSVQVSVGGSTEIISVTTKELNEDLKKVNPEAAKTIMSIQKMRDKIDGIAIQIDAFEVERKMLMANQSIGGQQAGVSLIELSKAADFFRDRMLKINNNLMQLHKETDNLHVVLDSLKAIQLRDEERIITKRKALVIILNSPTDQTAKIDLRYIVDNASWEPAYDIIATDISNPVKLKYKARIVNETAIDWKDVKLTLSTADPTLSASRPSLTTWTLNYSSQGNEGFLQNRMNNSMMKTDTASKANVKEISVEDLNASFEISKNYSILSGADPYTIEVLNETLNATYQYLAIPKVEASAFLIAKVTGWKRLNLIDGLANVYFGNAYIGESEINARQMSDTLELSFGRDNQILVSRAKLEDTAGDKLIGGKRTESLAYEISIKNNKRIPISIKVQDQIPVSQETDIVVDPIEISNATVDNLSGRLQWIKTMNPDQSMKFRIAFSVKYPKNKNVIVRTWFNDVKKFRNH